MASTARNLPGYTSWATVTTGANGTIPNGLPLKNPATSFQYRKRLQAYIPFAALGGSLSKLITGSWKIRILSAPNGTVLFEQTVQVYVVVEGGGIFFFWFFYPNKAFSVDTTICDGKTVSTGATGLHEGWKFVDYPRPTEFSETGPDADIRAGDFDDISDDMTATGGTTVDGGYIDATFQSAPYKCNIPAGAVLQVVSDKWQFGRLRQATYSFSFKGGGRVSAIWDRVGAFRMARAGTGGTILEHRYPGAASIYSTPQSRAFYEGVIDACVAKTADNALWILGTEATQGKLWVSEDDGTTKTRVTRKVDGREQELLVFGSGYEMIDLKVAPDGTLWALASKDSQLYVASSRDNWVTVKNLGKAKSPPYSLGISRDGTVLVASATHEYEYDGQNVTERPTTTTTPTS